MLIERAPDQKQIAKVSQVLELPPERVEELGRFADPDPDWKNGQWILKQFSMKNVDPNDSATLETLKSSIEKFETAKKAKGLTGNEANIDGYKRAQDLIDKINSLPPEAFVSQRSIKRKKADPLAISGSELVASDDNWRIYYAKSAEAMSLHGKGTTWCTRVQGGQYQCSYLGKGGTYVVYMNDKYKVDIRNELAAEGLGGWERVVPKTVPSESMPGWGVFAQFTPNLSEFRDIKDISVSNSWMKEHGVELNALIDGIPGVSAKKDPDDEDEENIPDIEQVRADLPDQVVERIDWAYEQGLSVTDGAGDNIANVDEALRYRHEDQNNQVYVESSDLSGDSVVAISNKRTFMGRHTTGVWQHRNGDISVSIDVDDEAWSDMTHLQEYSILDDDDYYMLLDEKGWEAWYGGYARDFQSNLVNRFDPEWKYYETAPDEDAALSDEEREFLSTVVIGSMDNNQLGALARDTDDEFPSFNDEGDTVYLDNDLDGIALRASIEDIVKAYDENTLKEFNGDVAAYLKFQGDVAQYQNVNAEQKRQYKLFPTGEPDYRTGPAMFKGESVVEDTHSYATTQAIPPNDVVALVQDARKKINKADLDPEEGFGPEPHVTILYGFDDAQEEEASEILRRAGPINAKVAGIDMFEAEGYDVVIFRVESEDLKKLHNELDKLPNENQWPDYQPHMTIAYVQSGKGKEYVEQLESGLVGKNFVANQAEFSNTADDRVVVDLREGTTATFENLSEQSPLFGVDVLTEEPDENQILGALYPVLNRSNRRVVSINSNSADQATALLDNGKSLDMTEHNGSWWATTGHGDYDLLSPTDQERLVKELNGVLESMNEGKLFETKAHVSQDGYDLVITFSQYPTSTEVPDERKPLKKSDYSIYSPEQKRGMGKPRQPKPKPEPEAGMEAVQSDPRQSEKRIDYVDTVLPSLQKDPEFAQLGAFKRHTIDSVRFVPHYRNWKDVKAAADRLQHLLSYLVGSTELAGDQIDTVTGVTSGDQISTSGGGLFGAPRSGGAGKMTWGERIKRFRGKGPSLQPPGEYRQRAQPAAAPSAPAAAPAEPTMHSPYWVPSIAKRIGGGVKRAAVSSYERAKQALIPTPPGRGQSKRPAGAQTVPPGASIKDLMRKGREVVKPKQGPVGTGEDTYTSDVSSTDTIPITRPTRKRRRGSVKIPGIKDAARRRVTHAYRVMGESISKQHSPIRVIMRPSQVEALQKKPVWSALSESGVISSNPFKMSNEEFFEIKIDTMRREWNEANTETLLDEVGAVAPQAHNKIIERVDPKIAAVRVLNLVVEIAGAQAEAELEDGARGTVAEWIHKQKLQGKVITEEELRDYLLGSVEHVTEILESITSNSSILELLKAIDDPKCKTIARAANKIIEDDHTSTGGSLSTMGAPSGAALGSVIQGYGEQDGIPGEDPAAEGPPNEVAVSSRTWEPGSMFKLHIQKQEGASDWVMREVVGHEGEGESSALIYKDETGNIMRLPHDQVDEGMSFEAVVSPDEMGVESGEDIPPDVGSPITEEPPQVPMESFVTDEVRGRVTEDNQVKRSLRRFSMTQNEAYLLRATDRAVRLGAPSHSRARRLIDELAGAPV